MLRYKRVIMDSKNTKQTYQTLHRINNNHIELLHELYLRSLLGDRYIDLHEVSLLQERNQSKIQDYKTQHSLEQSINNDSAHLENPQSFSNIDTKILHCKLCDLSKMVKDKERLSAFIPTKFEFLDTSYTTQTLDSKSFPKIAFVPETLRLNDTYKFGNNSLNHLQQNKSNDMLFDIIEKVFFIHPQSVFIFPFFKCVDIGDNQMISTMVCTQRLHYEHSVCKEYLLAQLEHVEFVVFFGENICQEFFKVSLHETHGKLLEFYTNTKKITCVCVHTLLEMIANPKLKKEAMINFMLLKNAIIARLQTKTFV